VRLASPALLSIDLGGCASSGHVRNVASVRQALPHWIAAKPHIFDAKYFYSISTLIIASCIKPLLATIGGV
jgi:hypothetical protein